MRTDMRKVLIERPRNGHSRCYHDIRSRQKNRGGELEDLPTCEGMRRPHTLWGERKEFSDLLGPLRGYLWSCRGRKWDDVWSEISNQMSNNTVDSHLKTVHVPQYIEIKCVLVDGKVYACGGRRFYGRAHEVDGLYVHPETGIVCEQTRTARKSRKVFRQDGIAYLKGEDDVLRPCSGHWGQSSRISRKLIGFEQEAAYIDGLWYWVVFATVPPPAMKRTESGEIRLLHFERTDFVTGKTVKAGRYRADKRQMSSHDLRRHNLING